MAKVPFYRVLLQENDIDITNRISSFRFEDCVDEDNLLVLKMPDVDIDFIDEISSMKGDKILFQYGFLTGEKTGNRLGEIKTIEVKYSSKISLTIKCHDGGYAIKKQSSNAVYEEMTSFDIVKSIADKFNFELDAEKTTEPITIPQGNKTYFEFLKRLAKKEGFDFFIVDNVIKFKSRDLSSDAVKLYEYGKATGNVLSFTPKYEDKGEANKVASSGIDDETGEVFNSETTPDQSNETGLGDKLIKFDINGNRLNDITESGVMSVLPETKAIDVKKQNEKSNKDALLSNLTATLKLELDTTVTIENIITISGVAKEHSGNWYIKKKTDKIDSGGAFTDLELQRNATNNPDGGDGSEPTAKNKTEGDPNAETSIEPVVHKYDANGNEIE